MTTTAARGEYRVIPLHLIDPPELAMRETFDEVTLVELADDIKAHGLIQPLVVQPVGARFRVIAGHRRSVALHMIEALEAPCIVRTDADVDPEALKVSENTEREDVNPAHEARYFKVLLERDCGNDTNTLASKVGRSREYVETRLLLLLGDARVLQGVADGKLTLSVARELNAIKDAAQRTVYIDAAIRGGVSGRQAREWRLQANGFTERQTESAEAAGVPPTTPTQPADSIFNCLCCQSDEDMHDMMLVYIHKGCYRAVLRPIIEGVRPVGS